MSTPSDSYQFSVEAETMHADAADFEERAAFSREIAVADHVENLFNRVSADLTNNFRAARVAHFETADTLD